MSRLTPKFKLTLTAYEKGQSLGNCKSLQQMECLSSVMDDKSVFVQIKVSELPLDDVCDAGAMIFCLSPTVFARLPQKKQLTHKSCFKSLSAATKSKLE